MLDTSKNIKIEEIVKYIQDNQDAFSEKDRVFLYSMAQNVVKMRDYLRGVEQTSNALKNVE